MTTIPLGTSVRILGLTPGIALGSKNNQIAVVTPKTADWFPAESVGLYRFTQEHQNIIDKVSI